VKKQKFKIPPRNATCRDFLLGVLIFKGLTARRLYKSFGVKGLRTNRTTLGLAMKKQECHLSKTRVQAEWTAGCQELESKDLPRIGQIICTVTSMLQIVLRQRNIIKGSKCLWWG
jgi:hypothetical protein